MKEDKILTAEEFINDSTFLQDIFTDEFNKSILAKKFIEFAKMHVKRALEEASEKANTIIVETGIGNYEDIDKDSILNAYPLDQIK